MNLVVVDIDQLKTIINDAVTAAMKQHHAPEQQDEILRKVEVAKELKVSLKTIGKWMKQGKLPFHRINTRLFFKRSDIMNAMKLPQKYQRQKE